MSNETVNQRVSQLSTQADADVPAHQCRRTAESTVEHAPLVSSHTLRTMLQRSKQAVCSSRSRDPCHGH